MLTPKILLATLSALTAWAGASGPAADGWEALGSSDGIAVYRKHVPGSPLVAFRGECLIDSSLAKIVSVLSDTSRKKEWIDRLVETRDVRTLSNLERVEYNHTDVPWPLADRDFVFLWSAKPDVGRKRLVVEMRSVDDPQAPPKAGVVRGEMAASTWVIEALEPGKTRVSVEIQADPRGSVPKWIVNLFQRSWPRKTLEGIRRQVKKPYVRDYPGVSDLL